MHGHVRKKSTVLKIIVSWISMAVSGHHYVWCRFGWMRDHESRNRSLRRHDILLLLTLLLLLLRCLIVKLNGRTDSFQSLSCAGSGLLGLSDRLLVSSVLSSVLLLLLLVLVVVAVAVNRACWLGLCVERGLEGGGRRAGHAGRRGAGDSNSSGGLPGCLSLCSLPLGFIVLFPVVSSNGRLVSNSEQTKTWGRDRRAHSVTSL